MPSNSTAPKTGFVNFTPFVNRIGDDQVVPAGKRTLPVKLGEARLAFALSAVCWAAETGLSASAVLSTFPRPTISAVIPLTVPVKVGEARLAFALSADCWALETGLSASEVLLTLPRPTIPAVIPPTVPVKVGEARLAFPWRFPSSLPIADRMLSLALIEPALDAKLVKALPVTVVAAMLVADCVPVTSPARSPRKFDAFRA